MFSMNDGEMVLPPEVTMKSRARSIRRSAPSRHSPMSPVRSQPSSLLHGAGRLLVVPVAVEQIGAVHQHLAVVGELAPPSPPARCRRRPGAETGPRWPLMMPPAVSVWPYISHHVDAEHLPERHGLGRQRRAAADHQLELVEAELVEDRPEHAGPAGAIERVPPPAGPAVPAPPRMVAREAHREIGGRCA